MFEKVEKFLEEWMGTLALSSSAVFVLAIIAFTGLLVTKGTLINEGLVYLIPSYALCALFLFFLLHREEKRGGSLGKLAGKAKVWGIAFFGPALIGVWFFPVFAIWEPLKRRQDKIAKFARKAARLRRASFQKDDAPHFSRPKPDP